VVVGEPTEASGEAKEGVHGVEEQVLLRAATNTAGLDTSVGRWRVSGLSVIMLALVPGGFKRFRDPSRPRH